MEFTFFMIKPDAVRRNLIGKIIKHIEDSSFRVRQMKMVIADHWQVYEHYREHTGRPFFKELIAAIIDKRVVVGAIVYYPNSNESVERFRELMGPYEDDKRIPGTIRGDYAIDFRDNSIHGSASREDALREFLIWFPGDL